MPTEGEGQHKIEITKFEGIPQKISFRLADSNANDSGIPGLESDFSGGIAVYFREERRLRLFRFMLRQFENTGQMSLVSALIPDGEPFV